MAVGLVEVVTTISVSVSIQDGTVELRKAHTCSALSLNSLLKVAFKKAPMFIWLKTDRSQPERMECQPLELPSSSSAIDSHAGQIFSPVAATKPAVR